MSLQDFKKNTVKGKHTRENTVNIVQNVRRKGKILKTLCFVPTLYSTVLCCSDVTVTILHLPNTRAFHLSVAAYEHLPSYLQEPKGSREGRKEEIQLWTASHASEPRGSPSAAALHTFVSPQYLRRSQSSPLCKHTAAVPEKTALPNAGDVWSPFMCAEGKTT